MLRVFFSIPFYHNCNFDKPVNRKSTNNNRGYVEPARKTEQLTNSLFVWQYTTGTNSVKKLCVLHPPMLWHLQLVASTNLRLPVLPLPSPPVLPSHDDNNSNGGFCDISYPDPDPFSSAWCLLSWGPHLGQIISSEVLTDNCCAIYIGTVQPPTSFIRHM